MFLEDHQHSQSQPHQLRHMVLRQAGRPVCLSFFLSLIFTLGLELIFLGGCGDRPLGHHLGSEESTVKPG